MTSARRFLSNPAKNRYDPSTQTLYLSKLFDWYRQDFEATAPSLPAFLARYEEPTTAKTLMATSVRVKFLDCDWTLNGRQSHGPPSAGITGERTLNRAPAGGTAHSRPRRARDGSPREVLF